MGAFRRRTQFAAPLILSVAASCSGGKDKPEGNPPPPPPKRFPGTTWGVTMRLPNCEAVELASCPPGASCNPPAPQAVECPPGASGNTVTQIGQLADKTCAIVPVDCYEPRCATLPTPCPLAPGQKLVPKIVFVWHIEKRGAGCHAEEEDNECPPGVDCNPPKPRMVACPPGITEDKTVDITQLADGTCAVVPDGCTTAGCVTDKTPCP